MTINLTAAETSLLLAVLEWHIDSGEYCGPREQWYKRAREVRRKIHESLHG